MTPIVLERADFFELLAALRLHEVQRIEAQIAQRTADQSGQRGQALFQALAQKYGFDPSQSFGFDEATCALIPR